MFICFFCKKSSQPRERRTPVITATRPAQPTHTNPVPTRGFEIVREESACPRCAEKIRLEMIERRAKWTYVAASAPIGAGEAWAIMKSALKAAAAPTEEAPAP